MTTPTTPAPESSSTASPRPGSGPMFDRIARRYDRLNRIISVGLDRRWRRRLIRALLAGSPQRVLDVASGTADVALALAQRSPTVHVSGVDPSAGMLAVGAQKVERARAETRIALTQGDAQALPFADQTFDAAGIAFGIRNVPDRVRGLSEMVRVTRPGGVVAVLELSEPGGGLLGPVARLHARRVVPRLGAWLSGEREYRYLQESVAAFPPPEVFGALMGEAGLVQVTWERLSFGAAYLYQGRCP